MDQLTYLKELIKQECDKPIDDPALDSLLACAELVKASAGECLVEAGQYSPDVWIVKSGIIRLADMDGCRERTAAFGTPGTIFTLKHSFVRNLPSYYELWACCDSELLKVTRNDFEQLLVSNHQFAVWMFHYAMEELFYQEKKNSSVSNGTAIEKFKALSLHRPELIEKVQQKHLASYLGVSPEYLCRLKKKYGTRV